MQKFCYWTLAAAPGVRPVAREREAPRESVGKSQAGCVGLAILSRYTEDKPFSVDDLLVVQGPCHRTTPWRKMNKMADVLKRLEIAAKDANTPSTRFHPGCVQGGPCESPRASRTWWSTRRVQAAAQRGHHQEGLPDRRPRGRRGSSSGTIGELRTWTV
jgi:hypothetical protein